MTGVGYQHGREAGVPGRRKGGTYPGWIPPYIHREASIPSMIPSFLHTGRLVYPP